MKTKYEAATVPILRFMSDADQSGMIIPPECYVKNKGLTLRVPVVFGDDEEKRVGWANIYRKGDILYGDFQMTSTMRPVHDAITLMRKLIPGIGFEILDAHGNIILMINVTHIVVTPAGNVDPEIQSFGDKLHCLSKEHLN